MLITIVKLLADIVFRAFLDVKILFQHNNLNEIISNGNVHFDFAILTYVIHEINAEERVNLLVDIAQISDKIIVGDYIVPRPKGFGSYFSGVLNLLLAECTIEISKVMWPTGVFIIWQIKPD